MRSLNRSEIQDLVEGCAVLGTGGGGSPTQGLELLSTELAAGREIKLIGLDDVPADALTASPYMCGSLSPEDAEERSAAPEKLPPEVAFRALADYLGSEPFAVIPTEIGGGNTAVALAVAARLGIPAVDADPAGRSVPELQHTTYFVQGVPIAPLAVSTAEGDIVIVPRAEDELRVEAIVRAVAVASGGHVGVADHPVYGRDLRGAVIPGTLSQALAIGSAIRQAREEGSDSVGAAIRAGQGCLLFSGKVERASWAEQGGFTVGEIELSGTEAFAGQRYRIWYKNEHIVSWLDGEPHVTVPDLICLLDPRTGGAITNPNCRQGMRVTAIGYPAPAVWRSSRGLEVLGPRHFGFDLEYTPLDSCGETGGE